MLIFQPSEYVFLLFMVLYIVYTKFNVIAGLARLFKGVENTVFCISLVSRVRILQDWRVNLSSVVGDLVCMSNAYFWQLEILLDFSIMDMKKLIRNEGSIYLESRGTTFSPPSSIYFLVYCLDI